MRIGLESSAYFGLYDYEEGLKNLRKELKISKENRKTLEKWKDKYEIYP